METALLLEQAVTTFRHTYYHLFVQCLWREPAAGFLATLQEEIDERIEAATAVHPLMGEGWQVIQAALSQHALEEVAEEFTRLFLGPHGPEVIPYESYYLTGQLFKGPLVALRGFLRRLGLQKQEQALAEPEDVLAFELEVMRWLVSKQMAEADPEEISRWLQLQATFLKEHLLIWVPACAQDIEKAQHAHFYRGVALLLRGFLSVERRLFRSWGLEEIPSLEQARQRYTRQQVWKGPTFDLSGQAGETRD